MQNRLRHSGYGLGTALTMVGGVSWNQYWAGQDNFYELWRVTGSGTMTGLIKGDLLTITGSGLDAIYAVPDTAAYKTIDTDYVFHKSNGDISAACDGNRLIAYDFPRVIVYYLNTAPYTIIGIGILDAGQSVNNKMRDDFDLSIWWDDTLSFYGNTKGNRLSEQSVWTAESVYPAVLEDGNTVGWFDFMEGITMDGSNLVSQWDSRIGVNYLRQLTLGNRPLWQATGVLFDGIDNYMHMGAVDYNQPEFIYIVFKQVAWSASKYILDGVSADKGGLLQYSSTPNIVAYAGGGTAPLNGNLAVGTFGILRLLFNGASSKSIVNDTVPVTGNFGAADMDGFTIGAKGGGAAFTNIEVKEIILRKIADAAGDEAAIYAYLATKYEIT